MWNEGVNVNKKNMKKRKKKKVFFFQTFPSLAIFIHVTSSNSHQLRKPKFNVFRELKRDFFRQMRTETENVDAKIPMQVGEIRT